MDSTTRHVYRIRRTLNELQGKTLTQKARKRLDADLNEIDRALYAAIKYFSHVECLKEEKSNLAERLQDLRELY